MLIQSASLIAGLLLFTFCKAQECQELISFKADQYYTNVNNKPDSLPFLACTSIQQKLGPQEIFLDFMGTDLNDEEGFLVTIIRRNRQPQVISIPKIKSNTGVKTGLGGMEDASRGGKLLEKMSSEAAGYGDYGRFLVHLQPYLQDVKTIYYSTSDVLNFVNLKHLKDQEGQYLFQKYHMVRLHTAASFFGNHHKLTLSQQMKALLVGNVSYECNETAPPGSKPEFVRTWPYLPGTKGEVNAIHQLLKPRHQAVLLDSCQATEKNVAAMVNSGRFDILHLATHGFYFKNADPRFGVRADTYPLMLSGIVLSGANDKNATVQPFNDAGMLTSMELLQTNISNIRLVVLSMCHSGEGEHVQSSAPMGLTLALLRQGIQAMMVSNRAVPDQETKLFMVTFYTYLSQNSHVDECFTATLRELATKHPLKDWSFFDLVH